MEIEKIIVKNRIRTNLGDLSPLKKSMQKYGLLHPIIINKNFQLITGERRLTAAKELGWTEIDVIIKNVSHEDAINIEMLENTTRKEFSSEEIIKGIKEQKKIHSNIFYKIKLFFQKIKKILFKK